MQIFFQSVSIDDAELLGVDGLKVAARPQGMMTASPSGLPIGYLGSRKLLKLSCSSSAKENT